MHARTSAPPGDRTSRRVAVTGLGVVSALGLSTPAFWDALVEGRCAIGPVTRCDVSRFSSRIGAEVIDFDIGHFLRRGRAATRSWSRPARFALAAGLQALADAGYDLSADNERIGVYVGTSIGALAEVFEMHAHFRDRGTCRPAFGFQTFHQSIGCLVSAALDCRGPLHTTSSGCNSGLDALGQAARLIAHGDADAMLVIGTDCELVPEVFAALGSAGALATRYNDDPLRASRPFDVDRDGNVLGEGAGCLLLEAADVARMRGARIYAQVAGFASRASGRAREYRHDAPDLDPATAVRTLGAALADAGWTPPDVDLVNANGSSSKRYDVLEADAVLATFGSRATPVPVYSAKGALGQHGAGSAAFQAITATLSAFTGVVPPTLNCHCLDPRCGNLRVVTSAQQLQPSRVLTHAIGFGGFYHSALAIERTPPAATRRTAPAVRWGHTVEDLQPTGALG